MSRRLEKSTPSLLQVNLTQNLTVYGYITAEDQLTVTFVKEEKINTRGQTVLRKQHVTCTDTKIEVLKKYLSLLENFKLYHVYARESAKTETNPFTYAQACSISSDICNR